MNAALIEVFQKTRVLGFDFHSDISTLMRGVPKLTCFCKITKFLDIGKFYTSVTKSQASLSKACEELLGSILCKVECISNWEERPLREAQMHYAALDAHVLLSLFSKLKEKQE